MSLIVVKKEQVFELYLALLPELRGVVIDEMDADDRCRFTRCSKLCHKEARSSKNYIYLLQLWAAPTYLQITVWYDKYDNSDKNHKACHWYIMEDKGTKYISCKDKEYENLWTENIDFSTDLMQFGAEYFKKLLELHQNKIKKLIFHGPAFTNLLKNYDFGVTSLNRLEILRTEGSMDTLNYLSKLRHPLKHLAVNGNEDISDLLDSEEICQISTSVTLCCTTFTYEQMLRLPQPVVSIPFGDITEIEIHNFIRSWQNGTLGKEVKYYMWFNSTENKFDIPKLFRLLGFDGDFAPGTRFRPPILGLPMEGNIPFGVISFEIEHKKVAGLKAVLHCINNFGNLTFKVAKLRN